MEFAIFLIIVSVVGFFYSINYQSNKSKQIKDENRSFSDKFNSALKKKEGSQPSKKLLSAKNDIAIAVDEKNNQIYFYETDTLRIYSYKDILQSEIVEDNVSVTKTSRTSQIGGALLGGIVAGGVGTIIGGLSGKTVSTENIKTMNLRVVMNDLKNPVYTINILNNINIHGFEDKKGISKNHFVYKSNREKADYWHNLLSVLVKQADQEDSENYKQEETNSSFVADELIKLKELLDQEIINKEEFEKQKSKLLL